MSLAGATLIDRWNEGAEAFRRGDVPPQHTDAADAWYYAQNAAAQAGRFR